MTPRRICLLGGTGSVGESTLDLIARHPDRFELAAVTARGNVDRLVGICRRFEPDLAVIADAAHADELTRRLKSEAPGTRALAGPEALVEATAGPETDTVMAAIVGAAGLEPALAAARAGKRILLANKEALVMAGAAFMEAVRDGGAELLTVDSEHNAVFQCLKRESGARRIVLTASGGPFRRAPASELADVTPEQACAHPTWNMGRKISVDSATLMNKGLEVIEAYWLFGLAPERIEVVVHPQSIVHAMVEFADGSVLAQMAQPDMRVPIGNAMANPERIETGAPSLDPAGLGALAFHAPDTRRFPCLELARRALTAGGTAPAALNAANEVAVAAFLGERLRFTAIAEVIERTVDDWQAGPARTLQQVLEADAAARRRAEAIVETVD